MGSARVRTSQVLSSQSSRFMLLRAANKTGEILTAAESGWVVGRMRLVIGKDSGRAKILRTVSTRSVAHNPFYEEWFMRVIRKSKAMSVGGLAVAATAIGAVAVGAFAIGALAIGRLAVGRIVAGKVKLKSVEIESLTVSGLRVNDLTVTKRLELPPESAGGKSQISA